LPPIILAPQPVLPYYIKTIPHYLEKYDRHYSTLLTIENIANFVLFHDETYTHAPSAAIDTYRGLGKNTIKELFERVHRYQFEMDTIETILHNRALQDGFVIMLDDWRDAWIYVHDEARYQEWVSNGEETGPISTDFFEFFQ